MHPNSLSISRKFLPAVIALNLLSYPCQGQWRRVLKGLPLPETVRRGVEVLDEVGRRPTRTEAPTATRESRGSAVEESQQANTRPRADVDESRPFSADAQIVLKNGVVLSVANFRAGAVHNLGGQSTLPSSSDFTANHLGSWEVLQACMRKVTCGVIPGRGVLYPIDFSQAAGFTKATDDLSIHLATKGGASSRITWTKDDSGFVAAPRLTGTSIVLDEQRSETFSFADVVEYRSSGQNCGIVTTEGRRIELQRCRWEVNSNDKSLIHRTGDLTASIRLLPEAFSSHFFDRAFGQIARLEFKGEPNTGHYYSTISTRIALRSGKTADLFSLITVVRGHLVNGLAVQFSTEDVRSIEFAAEPGSLSGIGRN
jgi:hypothetical protein